MRRVDSKILTPINFNLYTVQQTVSNTPATASICNTAALAFTAANNTCNTAPETPMRNYCIVTTKLQHCNTVINFTTYELQSMNQNIKNSYYVNRTLTMSTVCNHDSQDAYCINWTLTMSIVCNHNSQDAYCINWTLTMSIVSGPCDNHNATDCHAMSVQQMQY